MKQLIQNFKTGELYVDDLDIPAISKGMVLVQNKYSLISAGTEKTTVDVAKASLINKAKKRPDLVRQVIQNYKKEGFAATLQKVRTKLESLKALGYSTAGTVVSSMDTNGKFPPGTRVACGGLDYASHASFVSVPQNLVAKVPDNVSFEEAAFTTLGAIALQGVRQANPTLGENICVIGLGLLGQITTQLLHANGCKVFGIDISDSSVSFTNKNKYAVAYNRRDANLKNAAIDFSNGYGFDKVIITAGAPNNDPIVLATELLRRKGSLVLVGAVPMEIPRDPDFYKKELELKISCSYGPGRYDVKYEEEGQDYPIGYVRWTEQRNMEAFLDLLSMKLIDVKSLVTHTFDIENGTEAYDIILGKKKEPYIGMLLKYSEEEYAAPANRKRVAPNANGKLNIGFIGAGSFAQSYLVPNAKALGNLDTVVTRTGVNAKNVAGKFGFANNSTDPDVILKNNDINTLFIATQHDTHAKYVIEGLKHNKAVFVEKPLALTYEELEEIRQTYEKHPNPLMVGFNRRFSDVAVAAKKEFGTVREPLVMNFRVNAGFIPKDHWTQREPGGGRILGEVCHFIDLMQFFAGEPVKVYAENIDSQNDSLQNADNIAVVVKFANGSVGNLTYVANGDKAMPKEHLEIFGGNVSFVINDFRSGTLFRNNKETKVTNQGKGHQQEVAAFLAAVKDGKDVPISFDSLYTTTLVTLKILDSLSTGLPQDMNVVNDVVEEIKPILNGNGSH